MLTEGAFFLNPRSPAMPARLSAIKQISVNARDLPRATAFYRDSLGIRHLFDAPPQMSFFDCGGIRLLLGVAEKSEFDHPSSILYFSVDDIKSAHADLVARGVAFRDAPHLAARLPDREIWLAFFNDTEGNVHALTSEIAPK
jgi:predicted enzyme related to lactoylglutathione lyase